MVQVQAITVEWETAVAEAEEWVADLIITVETAAAHVQEEAARPDLMAAPMVMVADMETEATAAVLQEEWAMIVQTGAQVAIKDATVVDIQKTRIIQEEVVDNHVALMTKEEEEIAAAVIQGEEEADLQAEAAAVAVIGDAWLFTLPEVLSRPAEHR